MKKKAAKRKPEKITSTSQLSDAICAIAKSGANLTAIDEFIAHLENPQVCSDCNGCGSCGSCAGTGECPDCTGTGNCYQCSGDGIE